MSRASKYYGTTSLCITWEDQGACGEREREREREMRGETGEGEEERKKPTFTGNNFLVDSVSGSARG